MADNDNNAGNGNGRSESAWNEPPAVTDGCGLLPYVPRGQVSKIRVDRLLEDGEGRAIPATLPRSFGVDDTEEDLYEYAGGGQYRAFARDDRGRFVAGFPSRMILIDGAPKEPGGPPVRSGPVEPPAPPAPVAPVSPPTYAAQGLPVPSTLPGMPSVFLDYPNLPPELRAWLQSYAALFSYANDTWHRASTIAIESARAGAAMEKEAARNYVTTAGQYIENISGPALKGVRESAVAVEKLLGEIRVELATERKANSDLRDELGRVKVEAAVYRAILEGGGKIEQKAPAGVGDGLVNLLKLVAMRATHGGLVLVGKQMGLSEGELKLLTPPEPSRDSAGDGSATRG